MTFIISQYNWKKIRGSRILKLILLHCIGFPLKIGQNLSPPEAWEPSNQVFQLPLSFFPLPNWAPEKDDKNLKNYSTKGISTYL